jgi:hypothetical protein
MTSKAFGYDYLISAAQHELGLSEPRAGRSSKTPVGYLA